MKWHLSHAAHGNEPWAVQAEGMRRSAGRDRYFYALECGLGKTSLTLNDYVHYLDQGDVDLNVVLAPQSFKRDWIHAPDEWGVGHLPTALWPNCKDIPTDLEQGTLLAVNYEAASRSKAAEMLLKLLETRKVMLTIDESSVIKNHNSNMTKDILELAKRATMVRQLNGTPQVKDVMDWYPQLRAVGELNGWNPYQFKNKFAERGGYMGKKVTGIREDNADRLYEIIDGVTFRALKRDWRKDLPEQVVSPPIRLDMHPDQRRHYLEMMEEFYTEVNGMEVSAEMVLTQYDKLQQISSGIVLQNGEYETIVPPEKNPKLRASLDLIDGKKSIIVYKYRPTGRMLMDILEKEGLNPARIMGSTDQKGDSIIEEKKRFNEDPDCRVIVCQETAACMGHTLIGMPGDRCSRMVFFENTLNLRDRLQMYDRNYRGDQDEMCNIYDLATSPMDMWAITNLQDKKELADSVDQAIRVINQRDQWEW
jgi:hypothetical protein